MPTLFAVKTMVICLVAGCSKRSGRDKDVSFYRIPKIMKNNHRLEGLCRRRTPDGFIAAIGRSDLTETILDNDRICSRHFITGKPAELEDQFHPDRLPTLNLRHGPKLMRSVQRRPWRDIREQCHEQLALNEWKLLTGTGLTFYYGE